MPQHRLVTESSMKLQCQKVNSKRVQIYRCLPRVHQLFQIDKQLYFQIVVVLLPFEQTNVVIVFCTLVFDFHLYLDYRKKGSN